MPIPLDTRTLFLNSSLSPIAQMLQRFSASSAPIPIAPPPLPPVVSAPSPAPSPLTLSPIARLLAKLYPQPIVPTPIAPAPILIQPPPAPTPTPTPTPISTPKPPIIGTGNGLLVEYFDNADFTNSKATRIDNGINIDWKAGSPDSEINPDTFSVRWTGQIQASYSEEYTFFTTADDSVKLTINGKTIVEMLNASTSQERSGKLTLEAGKKYDIQLDYQENTGNAGVSLAWSSTRQVKQIVSQAQLYTNSPLPPTPPLPSIWLGTPEVTVREGTNAVATMRIDRRGSLNLVSTAFYTTNNGSAQFGTDYTATVGSVIFEIGESVKFVDIPILNDLISEGTKAFGFNLGSTINAVDGVARTSTITILDNDAPSMIELSRANFAVAENAGTINLIVNRSGNINMASSVNYATANGTAVAGQDYVTKVGTIDFAIGETTKNITIDITNNNANEISETFTVLLSDAIGANLGNQTLATVTIADDDGQPVAERFIGGLNQPIAFKWIPGSQTMFIAEKSGLVKVANGNAVQATPFLDFRDRVNDTRDRGLMDMILHPDFNNGKPYVYLLYVYDPAEATVKDAALNRNARLTRVRAQQDANGVWTAIPNSEEIIVGKNSTWANIKNPNADSTDNLSLPASGVTINPNGSVTNLNDYIAVESQSHAPGSVLFGPDGKLYVTIGDGTSYNNTDPRSGRVQDVNNLSGKVLRIDPDTGEGLADNPFWTGNENDNASKVYALGVRNGFRAVFGPTGQLVIGDVGWNAFEEVNVVTKGVNLGWPWFEGGAAGVPLQTRGYRDLQAAKDFYNRGTVTEAAAYAYNHDGKSSSIMVGDFYTGDNPVWQGSVFVADLSQGWVKALTFDQNGVFQQGKDVVLATPGNAMPYIADMNMGADGNMYYLNLAFGQIGRWIL